MIESIERASHRRTALVVTAMLFAAAAWNIHRGRQEIAGFLGGLAGILLVVGLFVPAWAARFHRAWMALAAILGIIQSRVLISIAYFGVLTPLGIAKRIAGHDSLGRRSLPRASYWLHREVSRQTKDEFERTF